MIDISKIFKDSFAILKKNRELVVLSLLFTFLIPILIFSTMHVSGAAPYIDEFLSLSEQYNALEKQQASSLFAAGNISENKLPEFDVYLEEKGFTGKRLLKLLTPFNIVLGIVITIISVIGSILLYCMLIAGFSISSNGKTANYEIMLSTGKKYLFRIIALQILEALIILLPIFVIVLLGILFAAIHPAVGIILAIILFVSYIVLLIIFLLRIIFAMPAMLAHNLGPVDAMKKSWALTNKRLKETLIIALVIFGVGIFSAMASQPANELGVNLYISSNIAIWIFSFIVWCILMAVQSVVFVFQNLLLFKSYAEFKKRRSDEK